VARPDETGREQWIKNSTQVLFQHANPEQVYAWRNANATLVRLGASYISPK
jgi:hypothetical protein